MSKSVKEPVNVEPAVKAAAEWLSEYDFTMGAGNWPWTECVDAAQSLVKRIKDAENEKKSA